MREEFLEEIPLDAPPEEAKELRTEVMTLNVGPQHPSTHGVLRLMVTLSGEEVLEVVPHIGYLHTGFEKTMEHRTYLQNITYTPRMDYLHSFAHDLAYALAVEKLVGAVVPPRAETIRVILNELSRLASHLVFLGTGLLDLGALTPFFYAFRERETILDLFEWVTGQRFHHNYIRIGGVKEDLPEEFVPELKKFLEVMPHRIDEYEALFAESPIFYERARGVGVIPPEVAIDLGLTGGSLRASGVNYDVRKAYPYSGYETYTFDVPLGEKGDVFDRMLVRIREMRESVKIIKQALERLEPGPVRDPNPQITPPPRPLLETSMEAVIYHFKHYTEGFHPPKGEVYVPTESARGELGYYIVSDGGSMPYRVKVRAPSFVNLQSLPYACKGEQVPDMVAIIASLDPVMGDVDR
ncbi:NADH-quinone oxidoreductase subunit 4 [Thermus thermophilus]|uniref:NADH-quinone oxidoreductase subunit D n=1 Tax=Thermus thermophilus TaxID=274 RepID=A0A3P4ATK6_THETH|nr:NADH dehydrogenase (quinone) subunit D [Thermus thermophilus]VCU53738.1 NADH-quinone oxidoreductase subunit 4 [Thermus thermophilus]